MLITVLVAALSAAAIWAHSEANSPVPAQQTRTVTTFRKAEPNRYAPELYVDKLKLRISLVDLPGAAQAGSNCEIEYQLYFIPEEEFINLMRNSIRGGRGEMDLSGSSGKILLAAGKFKPARLATLKGRTFVHGIIDFKGRVPDRLRTKFAAIITRYSVKINDARLNVMAYDAGHFITYPFADDPAQPERAIPRSTVYLNFYLSPQGNLFRSQLPRDDRNTSWEP